MPELSKSDLAHVRSEACTLADLLLIAADRWPDRSAIVFGTQRRTYRELTARAMEIARGLRVLGVRPGEHVGILLPNRAEFVEVLFGVAMCNAVAVLINSRYRSSELAYVVGNADVVTIVTTGIVADGLDFSQRLLDALPELAEASDAMRLDIPRTPNLRNIALLGTEAAPGCIGTAGFRAMAETTDPRDVHAARVTARVRDVGLILYTSGTSSHPKGCMISHEAIVRNSRNLARERWQYGPEERVWSPLPLFHVAALLGLLSSADVGGTFIGHERFDPGDSLRTIAAERATMLFLPFVTFLQAIRDHPDFARTDFSSVRLMNSCFAAMPAAVGRAYAVAMPGTIQVGTFGMTEGCGIATTGGPDMDPALGYTRLGYPMPGVAIRIADRETGVPLPLGDKGEILVRGYSLFEGYYGDPERTAEVLSADGWYRTGDIGSLDADGHLMFHGRTKDMLKVGGENVAAAEVEAVLARYPGVRLAQVVGVPDGRLAEIPAAFVELLDGATADAERLIGFCRGEMASFKVPRHIRFVDQWPMSASKIQKFRLRQRLMDELGLVDPDS